MNHRPPLSVCVVNYNGEAYLPNTLEALVRQKDRFQEILLIDNASEDGSLAITEQSFPEVKIIRLPENNGPGAARNAAFKSATCDLILMLDNDIVLTPPCAETLGRALSDIPEAAFAVPSVRYDHRRNTIQYEGAGCHFLGLMIIRNRDRPAQDPVGSPVKVNSLVSACFLTDRRKLGLDPPFDESFFFNLEDHDLGVRTRIFGSEIVAVPGAVCYHREGSTGLSYRKGKPYPARRIILLLRNRWQVILKHFHWKTLLLLAPVLIVYEGFQFVGLVKKGHLSDWIKGVGWTLGHLSEILRKRRRIQPKRKTPDQDILEGGPVPLTEDMASGPMERFALNCLNRVAIGYWSFIREYI